MNFAVRAILGFLLATWALLQAWAQNLYTPLELWRGEYLQANQGAFYVRLKLQDFKSSSRGQSITTNVFIHLVDERQNKRYVLSQALGEETDPLQIWKIPQGHYTMQKLTLNDNTGRTRQWLSPGKPQITIRKFFLTNMGLVTLSPFEKTGLKLRFQSQPNLYQNSYAHESFIGVVDGYTNKAQAKLGGKEVMINAQKEYSSANEARAVFSHKRDIQMIYRINLVNAPQLNARVAQTFANQDLDLRRCYMEELDRNEALRGNASFRFQIARSDGTMQKIAYRGGSLKSNRVVQCLYFNMGKMQFPIATDVAGDINFFFNYQDELGRAKP